MKKQIMFQVDPPDHNVGITSEGFLAWEDGSNCYCCLDDIAFGTVGLPLFSWWDDSGEPIQPPKGHAFIEGALVGFANGYYENKIEEVGS